MNLNYLKLIVVILTLSISFYSDGQEKKKKKGFFNKVGGLLKGEPGAFDFMDADKYWNMLENPELTDPESAKLFEDSLLRVSFQTKLSAYDEYYKGFYITIPRREGLKFESRTANYTVYFRGISKYRFLPMTEEDIKENFEPSLLTTTSHVDIDKEKRGNQDIGVRLYFKPDTFFINGEGNRVVVAAVSKIKVEALREPTPLTLGETTDNPPFAGRTIEDTELYRLFKNNVFDKKNAWPRVCINITHLPKNYQKNLSILDDNEERNNIRSIATATATIWYSENEKIEIPEFTYFPCDFAAFDIALADIGISWAYGLKGYATTTNNGYKRTGPLHPSNPIPTDQQNVKMCITGGYGNRFFGDLLYKMDFNWNQDDNRVWFSVDIEDNKEDDSVVW
nr:hypothetical protein [uncultured Carboxylicivirga sp.]